MEKKPRPLLTLKKKPAALPAPKAGKPAKKRKKEKRVLPPHRRPSETRARALVEALQRDFPALFPPDGQPIAHPWAVGIHGPIMHRYRESKRVVGLALDHWAKGRREEYARCVAEGSPRLGLDNPENAP